MHQTYAVVTARPTGICQGVFLFFCRCSTSVHCLLASSVSCEYDIGQATREMYLATFHWARPIPGLRPKPRILSPHGRCCCNSAAARIRSRENSPAIRSGDHRTNDINQFRNIVSPYFKWSERFLTEWLRNGFASLNIVGHRAGPGPGCSSKVAAK